MKNFDSLLFLGAGEHSMRDVKKLKRVLNAAIEWSGGMQQGPVTEEDLAIRFLIVSDIVAALTGHEMILGKKLRYPGAGVNHEEFKEYI